MDSKLLDVTCGHGLDEDAAEAPMSRLRTSLRLRIRKFASAAAASRRLGRCPASSAAVPARPSVKLVAAVAAAAPSDLAGGDWEMMFGAVLERLRLAATRSLSGNGAAARGRASVVECVAALGQLHAALRHERGGRAQLELEALAARAALALAHAELAGTRIRESLARHRALHDELTSLPNRGHFRERLASALGPAADVPRPGLAVLYIDLDGFKPINDAHGHDVGDELLRIVAARLSHAVRAEDMVCRLGGDEFACLPANDLDREQLGQLAGKLLDAVRAPVAIGALELSVRASIGIARCPDDGDTTEVLIRHADAAMYSAKQQRSGHAFFDRSAGG